MKLIQNSFTGVGSASVATTLTGSRIDITIYDQIEIEIDTIQPAVITVLYYPIDNKLTDVITKVYAITANNKSTLTVDILQRLIQVNVVINAGAHPYSFTTNAHRQYRPTEPIRASNTLELYSMLVGNWYQVLSIGGTSGAVWNQVGALLPQAGESLPPIGRAFCCLAIGPLVSGGGQVVGIVYSNNVNVSGSVIAGTVAVSNFPAIQPVSGSVSVSSLPAIGITNTSFDVSNFPASQPVTGTFFQATQPVSGSVSVSSLPAIGITNTSFDVSNFPASQPVTGTFFQATQPVSGTVSVDNFTPLAAANIKAISQLSIGQWFKVETLGNTSGAVWNEVGALIGGESSPSIGRVFKCIQTTGSATTGTVSTIIYNENVNVSNFPATQPVTGTFFQATQPVSGSVSVSSLPAIGITNTSFDVSNFPASQPVTGTFFQATQPVSGSVSVSSLPAIGITNTSFDVSNFPASQPVTGTFFQATQPVSGSVSVSSLPAIAITNIGFEVTNIPNVVVDTLPPIAITNIGFEVSNFTPDGPANTLSVSDIIAGQWYKVEFLGDTVSADWIAMGATFTVETFPALSRVFKALTDGTGTGTVSVIIYNEHVTVDNAVLEVNIASQSGNIDVIITDCTILVPVNISSSVGLDIASLPAIAITNTSFAVTNTNATAIAVKPVASGFAATITGPVTTINTTTAVSRTTIDLTSHQIKASGSGTITTMTLSSNLLAATLGTINFVKFYNLPTATQTDTPILKVGLLSNQSLTIDANISFTNGCCVRASNLWADSDTTAPTENITGAFFLRV